MGSRIKNFIIIGVHWKMSFLGGGCKKPIYKGNCLKRGGRLGGRVVFWGEINASMDSMKQNKKHCQAIGKNVGENSLETLK